MYALVFGTCTSQNIVLVSVRANYKYIILNVFSRIEYLIKVKIPKTEIIG